MNSDGTPRGTSIIQRMSFDGKTSLTVAEWMMADEMGGGSEDLAWRFCGALLRDGIYDDSDLPDVVMIYRVELRDTAELARQMVEWRAGHRELVREEREHGRANSFCDYPE